MLPPLLSPEDLHAHLPPGRGILLCTDYDGTLLPFYRLPAEARPTPALRELVARVATTPGVQFAFVTGRSDEDMREFFPEGEFIRACEHGMVITGGGHDIQYAPSADVSTALHGVINAWKALAPRHPGSWVQCKRFSASYHFRTLSDADAVHASQEGRDVAEPFARAGNVHITGGVRLLELRGKGSWHKGDALRHILQGERRRRDCFALFFGDDLTDEDGFAVLNDTADTLSVLVGSPGRASAARFRLADPASLVDFLELLASPAPVRAADRRPT